MSELHTQKSATPKRLLKCEALAIRDSIEQCILNGLSNDSIKDCRKQLAERYECSLEQVRAIGAHVKITADKAIKSASLSDRINAPDLLLANAYFEMGVSRRERRQLAREIARSYGINFKITQSLLLNYGKLVSIYRKKNNCDPNDRMRSEILDRTELIAESNVGEKTDQTPSGSLSSKVRQGTFVDYSNDKKERWRLKWKSYLDRNLPQDQRESARVLCLPGISPSAEVKHYIDLGIKPENIVAVESTKGEASKQFESSCREMGIVCMTTELSDAAWYQYQYHSPFSIVNLDFDGQLSRKLIHALRSIALTEDALVMINVQARREPNTVRDLMAAAYSSSVSGKYDSVDRFLSPTNLKMQEALARHDHNVLKSMGNTEMREIRSLSIDYTLLASIGGYRQDTLSQASKRVLEHLDRQHDNNNKQAEIPNFGWLCMALNSIVIPYLYEFNKRLNTKGDNLFIGVIAQFMITIAQNRTLVKDLEKWRYNSESGVSSAPFYSVFARVHTPYDFARRFYVLADFILPLYEYVVVNGITDFENRVSHRIVTKARQPVLLGMIKKSHFLEFYIDGKYISRANIGALLSDCTNFTEWRNQFLYSDTVASIQRSIL